jgi:hypothetical protein
MAEGEIDSLGLRMDAIAIHDRLEIDVLDLEIIRM